MPLVSPPADYDKRRRAPFRYRVASLVLVAGALLYLARPRVEGHEPLALAPFELLPGYASLREFVSGAAPLPRWLSGAGSDAAYAFALGTAVADAPRRILMLGLVVLLGHEVAQGVGLASGTFDPWDLVVLLGFFFLAQLLFRTSRSLTQGKHP